MERRTFLRKSALATAIAAGGATVANAAQDRSQKEVYELRIYELRWGRAALDEYLGKALIPALNRLGVKNIGVFSEIGKSEPAKIYVLIPYASFAEFGRVTLALTTDNEFAKASESYHKIPQDQAVFSRYESSLLLAFDGHPRIAVPASGPRIFELRTYEGYSEDAVTRKVRMFNEHEFDIFNRVGLHPVFFGEAIAGRNLPCLTYMIWFTNMEERDRNWKAFGDDPDWKRISQDPQYANTVSRIHKTFLEPVPWSQV